MDGAASLAYFRWFSGFTVRDAKAAVAALELQPVEGTDLLATAPALAELEATEVVG